MGQGGGEGRPRDGGGDCDELRCPSGAAVKGGRDAGIDGRSCGDAGKESGAGVSGGT